MEETNLEWELLSGHKSSAAAPTFVSGVCMRGGRGTERAIGRENAREGVSVLVRSCLTAAR